MNDEGRDPTPATRVRPALDARSRRSVLLWLLLPLAVGGCVASGPPVQTVFPPLTYDYLTKIPLNVAQIDIDDSWQPPFGPGQVGDLSPVRPVAALRQMARDRLLPAGNSGRAVFKIEDASILQFPDRLQATFAVQLTVSTTDGTRSGYAEARVVRSLTLTDTSAEALRAALYDLTRSTMDDMNVEFEYQIRRSLRDYLQGGSTADTAPPPPPVQSQSLPPPGAASPSAAAPQSLAPRQSPPPQYLTQPQSPPPQYLAQPQPSIQPTYPTGPSSGPVRLAPPPYAPPAYPPPAIPPSAPASAPTY